MLEDSWNPALQALLGIWYLVTAVVVDRFFSDHKLPDYTGGSPAADLLLLVEDVKVL